MPLHAKNREALLREIAALKKENKLLQRAVKRRPQGETVRVPEEFRPLFDKAQATVGAYFEHFIQDPSRGTIEIKDERYVLVRASALSYDFLNSFRRLYADRGEKEAMSIGRNFLFDIAHLIGMEDAKAFHRKMNLVEPIEKLSAGPVHFAYSGWAFVDILPESAPSADENYYLKYHHPYSFEADSWIKSKEKTDAPVCIMNSGYSSGWCEASYGIPLTAVEIACKACGDDHCTFIMAPPDKIGQYLKEAGVKSRTSTYSIPTFFERKATEEKINASLKEKEVLLKEIHHRVKNNLQIISSLLNLQTNYISDRDSREKMSDSINRIQSMALIHEMLYGTQGLSSVNIRKYLDQLLRSLEISYSTNGKKIDIRLELKLKKEALEIDRAIPFGLILNELVSNSFKHAFYKRSGGNIRVKLEDRKGKEGHGYTLTVEDDGVGVPEDFKMTGRKSFGMELISILTDQLDAAIRIEGGRGTRVILDF